MAVSIPSGIYSLGAVQFNSQPLATLEGQLLAKREAREKAEQDAITKYVDAASQKVTPAGVRVNDLPEYFKQVNEWKRMGQSLTPNDKIGRLAFDQKGQKILGFIEASKAEQKKAEPLVSAFADPVKRREINVKRAMDALHQHDLPLNDPNRKSLDYSESYFNPPVYDFDKDYKEVFSSFKPSKLETIKNSTDPKTGKLKIREGLTDDAIKQGAENFVFKVKNNPTSLDFYERLSDNMDAKEMASLAPYVHKYFPDLQVDADHPLAIAAGLAIKQAEVKTIRDEDDAELAHRRGLERAAASRSTKEPEEGFIDYWEEMQSKPELVIGNPSNKSLQVQGVPLNSLSPTAQQRVIELAKSITGNDYTQSDLMIKRLPNGTTHVFEVQYGDKTDKSGNPFPTGAVDKFAIKQEDINVKPQVGVKQKVIAVEKAKQEGKGAKRPPLSSFTKK